MSYAAPPLPPDVVAAIVSEAETGASSRAIAAKVGVSAFSVRKYANLAGISLTRPQSTNPRPETCCRECGAKCRSAQRLCWGCWDLLRSRNDEPAEDVALSGGRWIPRGGIQVWEASA